MKRVRLLSVWDTIWSSYWFVPAGMTLLMIVTAVGLPLLDAQFEEEWLREFFWLEITPRSAQTILSTIATASVSIVGVVFSLTILTLSIASSQMGPRLIRTFMAEPFTHFALGLYSSTAVYCLILLSVVKDVDSSAFVPHLSVLFALAAAIFGLGFLVFFINRVAQLIQAPNIVDAVAHDLDQAIDRLFPIHRNDRDQDDHKSWEAPTGDPGLVRTLSEGYLQGIQLDSLTSYASREDLTIKLLHRPGQYLARDACIAEVWPQEHADDALRRFLDEVCVFGNRRTPRQDLECAISELSELAVRSLSPGINDPFTATNCVDRLGGALGRLAERHIPSPCRYDDEDVLRVIVRQQTFSSALNAAFDQIRQYGSDCVAILIRLLESLHTVASRTRCREDREAIRRQAEMILGAMERHIDENNDQADIRARYDRLIEFLNA